MYTKEFDHCQIVQNGLESNNVSDDMLGSVGVLAGRLEQLKKTHRAFLDIEFSDELQAISSGEMTLAVS
ncbi:MAG: hypothetical protein K8R02_00395 [Anaerohalosphaeraceae bacterium]|nr:hypothetical protein [Anaerohalosphaeraceae bacterium]